VFKEGDDGEETNQYVGGGRTYEAKKVVNFVDLNEKPGYFEGLLH